MIDRAQKVMNFLNIWCKDHTENPGAKIGFLVLKNMFKGQQMKIEGLLAAIAH